MDNQLLQQAAQGGQPPMAQPQLPEEPQIPPAPEYGMSITQGSMAPPPQGPPPQMIDTPPPDPQMGQPDPGTEGDQVLQQLLAAEPPTPEKVIKVPMPDYDTVVAIKNTQQMLYSMRNDRINRDIQLYRQGVSFVPGDFDRRHDTPWINAFVPNLVNKMANMLSAPEPRIIVPFKDEPGKVASQAQENFGYWCRRVAKKYYSRSGGGNLQWDEFFYLLLHGNLVARILPDPDDEDYPFYFSLIDPAQCYPVFKGDKSGLDTMVRVYQATAQDIVFTYGRSDPKLEKRIKSTLGYTGTDLRGFMQEEGECIEYWDKMNRMVIWRDMVIMKEEHQYGFVPYVVISARGEPKSLSTPLSNRSSFLDEYGNTGYGPSRSEDFSNKSVSVFHHLIHTNRLDELIRTIHLMDVEKSLNPPTITYVAPQYQTDDAPPLNLRKKGNNRRVLNYMKVEAVPTSPRPTDVSPLIQKTAQDLAEGSLPPVAHGAESGSNVSGFAVESLIAVAKDATLPYTIAWENYLAQVVEMKLRHYKKWILPLGNTLSIPAKRSYGASPLTELTYELMETAGIDVEVKLWAMSQQMLPGQIQAAASAVQAGIWSLRRGMEHTGSTDPDKDFQDIISERAIQHPSMMEDFLIPQAFIARGQPQLAELWNMLVVMPKMQQMMMASGGPQGPSGPSQPGSPPEPNGQSNPAMGDKAKSTGGGPPAGMGRGPAPSQ